MLFPASCELCARPAEPAGDDIGLCSDCARSIARERSEPACPTCGASVALHEVSGDRCGECRDRPARLTGTVRVGPYADHLGRLLRMFKFHAREDLGTILAGWLADAIVQAPWLDRVEAVTYVPTHWRRRISRSFYPARFLAKIVSARTGIPLVPLLQRVRPGPRQVGLSFTQRARNVRGAFALRRGVSLHRARVLVIDDVKTTGATIGECAKVLRQSGAAEVFAGVIVRVRGARPGARLPTTL